MASSFILLAIFYRDTLTEVNMKYDDYFADDHLNNFAAQKRKNGLTTAKRGRTMAARARLYLVQLRPYTMMHVAAHASLVGVPTNIMYYALHNTGWTHVATGVWRSPPSRLAQELAQQEREHAK